MAPVTTKGHPIVMVLLGVQTQVRLDRGTKETPCFMSPCTVSLIYLNSLFHVFVLTRNASHNTANLYSKGFVRNVPGAPMCGCVEQMPVATKSACTQVNVVESGVKFSFSDGKLSAGVDSVTVDYKDCANDAGASLSLGPYYKSLVDKNLASGSLDATLVGDGNCATAVGSFLQTQSLKRA